MFLKWNVSGWNIASSILIIIEFNVHQEHWLGNHNIDTVEQMPQQMYWTVLAFNCSSRSQPEETKYLVFLQMRSLPGLCDHHPVVTTRDTVHHDIKYSRKVWRTVWPRPKDHLSQSCSDIILKILEGMDLFIPSKAMTKRSRSISVLRSSQESITKANRKTSKC